VSASGVAILVSLGAGIAGGVQVAIAGAFGRRIGVLEATSFAAVVGALAVLAATVVVRQGVGGVAEGFRVPPWLWLGGVMGAIVITTISYAPQRIGTFATIGLLIAGQLVAGAVIDALGLFGLEKIPLTLHRIVGLVLLAVGALLVLRR
jgi:transporter family-2 protein